MAILNIEGFDTYNIVSDTLAGWTSNWSCAFIGQILLNPGRYGGQCTHINAGGGQENSVRNFNWTTNTITVGFDYRVTSLNVQLFTMGTVANGSQWSCAIDSTGHVTFYRGNQSVLLGTATIAAVTVNTWCYIEVGVFVHATAGTVDVWVDGVNVLHLTGQNTKAVSTTDQMNQMTIYESGVADWDNMYWADTIATIGPMQVLPMIPATDQVVSGYTAVGGAGPLYDCIDELTPDGDSTYITSSNSGDVATFGYGTLSATKITALQLYVVAKKSDAGVRSLSIHESDGTNTQTDSIRPLTTSYAQYNDVLNLAPDGTAWTTAKFNAASFGVKTTQ